MGDAYADSSFPEYYDHLVDNLPPEFEVNISRIAFASVIAQVAERTGSTVANVLDLCTGSGRIILSVLAEFTRTKPPANGAKVRFVGIDNSEPMLQRAAWKLANAAPEDKQHLAGEVYLKADNLATFNLPEFHNGFHVILLGAGSFHHLVTVDEQLSCLREIRNHLIKGGAGVAIVDLFGEEEFEEEEGELLFQDIGTKFQKRTASKVVSEVENGDKISTETFEVVRKDINHVSLGIFSWSLRSVSTTRFKELAAAAGLEVIGAHATYGDYLTGKQSDEESQRVFFLTAH